MARFLIPLLAIVTLSGCQLLGGAAADPGSTFNAETVDTINNSTEVINQQFTFKQLLLFALLAGWAIPGPMEFLGGIFKGIFGGIASVVKLFK